MAPHEANRTPTRAALFACAFACLLGAFAPARATHVFVEPGNPSAYQTINAALAAQSASLGAIETVLVAPGVYPETLAIREVYGAVSRLIGTEGAAQTTAYGARLGFNTSGYTVEGLRFLDKVIDTPESPGHPQRPPLFRRCIFEGGASFSGYQCMWPNLFDCTFRGDTELLSYTNQSKPHFSGLRFEGCRLETMPICGNLDFDDCVFVGTPDTALVAHGNESNPITFRRCSFDSIGHAVVVPASTTQLVLEVCSFRDVEAALTLTGLTQFHPSGSPQLTVNASSFERVGLAIRTTTSWAVSVSNVGITDCSGPALDVITHRASLAGLHVTRAGQGALLHYTNTISNTGGVTPSSWLTLDGCTLEHSTGNALVIEQWARSATSGRVAVRNSVIVGAGGAGVSVTARGVTIAGNLVSGVQGDGIVLRQLAPAAPDSIVGNTVAFATGRGIALERDSGVSASTALLSNNIAVFSGQAGISVGASAAATVQQNDAWQNSLADFDNVASPLTANLSANPLFCAVGSGDYTLQAGSPCAPSGIYGLIGAMPVACAASPVGVTPRSSALALAVGPNPSLGGVRFVLPSRAKAAELEVLDLAGRRVWSAQLAPHAESLEWNGRVRGVRASGVFFARLRMGGETATERFVILR